MNAHLALLPILIPLTGAAAAILLRGHRPTQTWFALGVMLAALAASSALLYTVWTTGAPVVFQLGAWAAPFGISIVGDLLSTTMAVMCQVVLVGGFLYAAGCKDRCAQYPMFYPLFLTLAAGLTGGMLTGDLFNLFVFAELLVISGAALTAISDDRLGAEAAYKYFYISLIAALFLLLACGALYISYGTLNMADLARSIAADPGQPLRPVAMVCLMGFFMIKSAVIPFHFWQPDFHTAAPTPISAMLSSVVVKLGVYGFLRMTTLLFAAQATVVQSALIGLGLIGVVFGGLAAAGTHNVKRMLAYSTLAQVGYILLAVGWGTPAALAAAIVFTVNHSLVKSALLMLAGSLASRASVKSAAFEIVTGLGRSLPFTGLLFLLGGLALIGIPPLNGFISKLMLFRGGVEAGQYLPLLAAGAASIITLIYVSRAFQRIWWAPPAEGATARPYGDSLAAPTLLIALCLTLGLWAEPLVSVAYTTGLWLSDPANYIRAVLGA